TRDHKSQPSPGLAVRAFSLLALPQKDVWRIAPARCSGDFARRRHHQARKTTANATGSKKQLRPGSGEEVVPASDYRALQNQVRELHRLLGKKTLEAEILKEALGSKVSSTMRTFSGAVQRRRR